MRRKSRLWPERSLVVVAAVAVGRFADAFFMAVYATRLLMGLVEHDTCEGVVELLFVPSLIVAAGALVIHLGEDLGLAVALLAVDVLMIGLEGKAGGDMVEKIIRALTMAMLAIRALMAFHAGFMQLDLIQWAQRMQVSNERFGLLVLMAAYAAVLLMAVQTTVAVEIGMAFVMEGNLVVRVILRFKNDELVERDGFVISLLLEIRQSRLQVLRALLGMARFAGSLMIPLRMAAEALAVIGALQPRFAQGDLLYTFRVAVLAGLHRSQLLLLVMADHATVLELRHACMRLVIKHHRLVDILNVRIGEGDDLRHGLLERSRVHGFRKDQAWILQSGCVALMADTAIQCRWFWVSLRRRLSQERRDDDAEDNERAMQIHDGLPSERDKFTFLRMCIRSLACDGLNRPLESTRKKPAQAADLPVPAEPENR